MPKPNKECVVQKEDFYFEKTTTKTRYLNADELVVNDPLSQSHFKSYMNKTILHASHTNVQCCF